MARLLLSEKGGRVPWVAGARRRRVIIIRTVGCRQRGIPVRGTDAEAGDTGGRDTEAGDTGGRYTETERRDTRAATKRQSRRN